MKLVIIFAVLLTLIGCGGHKASMVMDDKLAISVSSATQQERSQEMAVHGAVGLAMGTSVLVLARTPGVSLIPGAEIINGAWMVLDAMRVVGCVVTAQPKDRTD